MKLASSLTPAGMDEILENVLQPDLLAAEEYITNHRSDVHLEAERNLMLAVLEDAMHCYQRYAFNHAPASRRLYSEAEKWLWKNDWNWPFSFRNICEVLALNPYFLRRGLLRWREGRTAQDSRPNETWPHRNA